MLYMAVLSAIAQQMVASAPQQVAMGQQFRLTYTVNSQDVSGFKVGQIPSDGFEVLIGPTTSSQSRISIVNGKTTQSSSVTYTFILMASKNGTFTIPAAQATVDGKQVTSNTVKIQVVGTAQPDDDSQQGSRRQQRRQQASKPSSSSISPEDLFITVTASKRRVVEQEPVLLTYKVYTLVNLTQLEGKMPELNGFHTQEIELPQQKSFQLEQYNGRTYKTVTWSQYVVFPQKTGKVQIPSITFNGVVILFDRTVDPFEAFFNGGSSEVEVKKQIKAPSVEIQVDPLPQRPATFSGGVGRFSMKAEVDKSDVKANDPITLTVTVSGAGNLKLIKEPQVQFPKDFDTYDVKIADKTRLTTSGVEGSMVYEYLTVPRHQGKFEIPPIEFTYFDPQTKQYQTLTSEAFQLNVARGDGSTTTVQNFGNQEDIQLLGSDIRFIKQGDVQLRSANDYFFGSSAYWALMAAFILLFVVLFVVFRKRMRENADVVRSKGKKANKVATKRLKKAAALMRDNKPNEFYDETLRALWGYVGDKLNMAVEQLSHDNITEKLQASQVDAEVISRFVEAIDECEYERYAPGDPKGNMNKVYEKAMTAIEQIEGTMKKGHPRRQHASMLQVLTVGLWLSSYSVLTAQTKAEADSSFVNGRYQEAIEQYEQLLQQGVSAELYYNLGNAYYRTENITKAILNYERALLLSPGDGDIRFNLQMARSKTVDKIVPESEMFFVTWYRSLVNMASVDGWARFALVVLALAVVLLLAYLFGRQLWLRKTAFFGAVVMVLLFLLSNLFAWQQKKALVQRDGAIITDAAVTVKSTPDNTGVDLFVLHEGTKVKVEDEVKGWQKIKLPDGKEGWVGATQLEII